ncbi:MAG: hypothetical protein LBQ78_03465 [Tannerellaceae bacterium]|jgi:hypothetical protein|nr:hypothetical protein [Tannerellaceae bacterium]
MRYLAAFLLLIAGICLFYGCLEDPDMPGGVVNAGRPEVDSLKLAGAPTATTVHVSARIIKQNGSPVVEYGFRWRIEGSDRMDSVRIEENIKKDDTFARTIEGLKNKASYDIQAFAVNEYGISYSGILHVVTIEGVGVVATLPTDNAAVRGTSAVCVGKVMHEGEGEILSCGIFYSEDQQMLRKDTVYAAAVNEDSTFVCTLTGLKPLATYYIQAFVENGFGMFPSESPTGQFTTKSGLPAVGTIEMVERGYTEAILRSEVTDGGDTPVTMRGFCWGMNELPDTTGFRTEDGEGDGVFTGTLKKLASPQEYYVRAYAKNSFGVTYSQQLSFITRSDKASVRTHNIQLDTENGTVTVNGEVTYMGETAVTAYGVSWAAAGNPLVFRDSLIVSSGMGAFTGVITELKGETVYHVRTFAVNGGGVAYGDTLTTAQTPRVLDTMPSFTGGYRIAGSCAVASIGNVGYLLGGDTGPQFTDKLWSYNASIDAWQELLSFPDGNFKWQTAVGYPSQNIICVFGGVNGAQTSNKHYWYWVDKNEWEEKQVLNGPAAYHSGVGASFGFYVYFIGGRRDTVMNEFWSFYPVINYWERKADFPVKQYGGVAVAINDTIFAGLGVTNPDNGDTTGELWKTYSVRPGSSTLNGWEPETTIPSAAGKVKAGVAYKGSIYVVDDAGTIWRYNVSTKKWTQKMTLPANNRRIHCMYTLNNHIYIGLGENSSSLLRYKPVWDN